MEADWEVEIGGGAPVIDAHWPGFIDLRAFPDRISEIAEAREFQPLANLLLRLNSNRSPLWTSKCDMWRPAEGRLACYIDLLPRDGSVFAEWKQAEAFCRDLIVRLRTAASPASSTVPLGQLHFVNDHTEGLEGSATLVIREALLEDSQGFGITAYFSTDKTDLADAEKALVGAMEAFADSVDGATFTEGPVQS